MRWRVPEWREDPAARLEADCRSIASRLPRRTVGVYWHRPRAGYSTLSEINEQAARRAQRRSHSARAGGKLVRDVKPSRQACRRVSAVRRIGSLRAYGLYRLDEPPCLVMRMAVRLRLFRAGAVEGRLDLPEPQQQGADDGTDADGQHARENEVQYEQQGRNQGDSQRGDSGNGEPVRAV